MTKLSAREKIETLVKAAEADDKETGMALAQSLVIDFFETQEKILKTLECIADALTDKLVDDPNQGKLDV